VTERYTHFNIITIKGTRPSVTWKPPTILASFEAGRAEITP